MAQTKTCRYCGNMIESSAQNCPYCGRYLYKKSDNTDLVCAECKAPVNTDDNFCQACGAVFSIPEHNIEIVPIPVKGNQMGIPYNIIILLTSFAASIAITLFMTVGQETSIGKMFLIFGIAFVVTEISFYLYFLPSIIAIEKNHRNASFIYLSNLLLGLTVIGWFIPLTISLQSDKK